jgi:P27 family predicted phage terminase small subunit
MGQAANGRPAQPPALRLLKGRGVVKGVARDQSGDPLPIPPPFKRGTPIKPDDLSEDASWMWDLVVEHWYSLDLLKPLDAASLEVVCETYARWKEAVRWRRKKALLAPNSQGIVTAPWVGIEERASRDFRSWCAEFGLTPAAENKVGLPGVNSDDNVDPFG